MGTDAGLSFHSYSDIAQFPIVQKTDLPEFHLAKCSINYHKR